MRRSLRWTLVSALLVLAGLGPGATTVAGQAPAGTNIVLLRLNQPLEGAWSVGDPIQVTDRPGYDNQPSFTPDGGSILFTSIRGEAPADIYRFDLISRKETRLTDTPEAEYSGTVMPDGSGFSVIRVEADGTQRLWAFDMDGSNPRLLLEEIAPVGYHAWLDNGTLALFVLGEPATLQLVPPGAARGRTIASNIGRSLHRIPGEPTFSFMQQGEEGNWITALDPLSGSTRPVAPGLDGSQDYAWAANGSILMANAAGLQRWKTARRSDSRWEAVTGLPPEFGRITRMAVSPNGEWLAVVVATGGS